MAIDETQGIVSIAMNGGMNGSVIFEMHNAATEMIQHNCRIIPDKCPPSHNVALS
jgi:hypothetical protein